MKYSLLSPLLIPLSMTLFSCAANVEKVITESKNEINVANIYAVAETAPVATGGDAADDPAVWLHPQSPEKSLVLGTDKKWGLEVYNLSGERVQRIEVGRVNNVDLRQNVLKGLDIAVASNRTANTLTVFSVSDEGTVIHLGDHALTLPEPYGTCMYKDANDTPYVFVNDKNGSYEQWEIESIEPLKLTQVRHFSTPTQPEGCAANDSTGVLYFGEEEAGVWRLDLNDASSEPELLTTVSDGALVTDVEGLDIYHADNTSYLVVSSQGDFSYAVYALEESLVYKGSFRVIYNEQSGIDGSQETDGLAVHNAHLGSRFPNGILVVQDGYNEMPREAQNFKYVSWADIKQALSL